MTCMGTEKKAETKTYKVVADTRLTIAALRVGEDFNPIVCEGVPIDSAVQWLGEGSEITLRITSIDKEKWRKYLEKKGR